MENGQILQDIRDALQQMPKGGAAPWSDALERGSFQDALAAVDARLAEDQNDLTARLAWVQCQLELGTVPVTALSSPLEELLPKVREHQELYPFVAGVCLRLAEKLIERKQLRLCVLILERALEFSLRGPARRTAQKIGSASIGVLREEIRRAETKRESKQYVASLHSKLDMLSKADFVSGVSEDEEEELPKPERRVFDSRSIMEAAAAAESSAAAAEPEQIPQAVNVPGAGRSGWSKPVAIAAGLIAMIAGLWQMVFTHEHGEDLVDRLAFDAGYHTELALALPRLEVGDVAPPPGAGLEEIRKRLENRTAPPKKEDEVDRTALKWTGKSESPASSAAASSSSAPPEPKVDPRKVPELDPGKLAQSVLETVGASQAGNAVGEVVRGPDGRIYGPPPRGGQALDGSAVQPHEVQQFKDPVIFRIIVRTEVMSAPSVIATSLARLEPDAKVQVVSRMGKWLELRSTGGRRGYIYAQDAVEESKPAARR